MGALPYAIEDSPPPPFPGFPLRYDNRGMRSLSDG